LNCRDFQTGRRKKHLKGDKKEISAVSYSTAQIKKPTLFVGMVEPLNGRGKRNWKKKGSGAFSTSGVLQKKLRKNRKKPAAAGTGTKGRTYPKTQPKKSMDKKFTPERALV